MILEHWILEFIDQTARDALGLPASEREGHYLKKTNEIQREALHTGRSLQEVQDIGTTFLDGTRLLVRQLQKSAKHEDRMLH